MKNKLTTNNFKLQRILSLDFWVLIIASA